MAKAQQARILIVDDEESVCFALETILSENGTYAVETRDAGKKAMAELQQNHYDLALVDLTLQDLDGLSILRQAREQNLQTEIVLVTGHGSIDTAVEAMRLGAYDYLTKPVDSKDLLRVVNHALERSQLMRQNRDLQDQIKTLTRYQDLIGKSSVMQELFRTLEAVAASDASVLITGESGTGKELVAHAIHKRSERSAAPFVAVNCAALPANILESELFGHEKGAFTGAVKDKAGYFEQAHSGTLFLDELTEMPFEIQAKLLRALETQTFRRVGGSRDIKVDVRVLAASNQNIQDAVENKVLREDVFYRLAVVEVELPALRERVEDIPLIASELLRKFAKATNKSIQSFAPDAMELMLNYAWPGNVRELRNAIERAVILSRGDHIEPTDLPPRLRQVGAISDSEAKSLPANMVAVHLGTTVEEMERQLILRTLEMQGNNKTRAAEVLGVSLKTLHNKLNRYAQDDSN
ncbi:MAG: sigma-54-dependent Fis family transcriptional regulator [Deferribacteres bacterium]|nr:sigma-54-dependent Fis family transcriptional regulator [candidate division KSB1 bacterium]MCB9511290.1 sigma-54-dependent Fis family transcriptional regulator [Deferribacteres bacterium]